jgi:CDGSH-type Zn-finger protein
VARRGLASPPRQRGAGRYRRPVGTGAVTFAVFYGAARAARRHRALRGAIASVLRYAEAGSAPRSCSSRGQRVAEELFFRGALWSRATAAPHHHARLRGIDRRYRQPGAGPGRTDPRGPLLVRGDLVLDTPEGPLAETRAALCACGRTRNQPFCDGACGVNGGPSGSTRDQAETPRER